MLYYHFDDLYLLIIEMREEQQNTKYFRGNNIAHIFFLKNVF